MNSRGVATTLFAILITVLMTGVAVVGHSDSEPVQCSIENQTPSVAVGVQARYVVHLSGGLGTYNVTMAYGDGQWEQGTYSSSAAAFTHFFSGPGTFTQTASVSGAGSQTTCSTQTYAY